MQQSLKLRENVRHSYTSGEEQMLCVLMQEKKHFTIISNSEPEGRSINLLGVSFDTRLKMDDAVAHLANETHAKLRTLLRTQRFFDTKSLVFLFKSRILGYIEYRTAAIYHASAIALVQLDLVYARLLRAATLTEEEALLNFGLAPLSSRRDIAMLGLIHRTVSGGSPNHFKKILRTCRGCESS